MLRRLLTGRLSFFIIRFIMRNLYSVKQILFAGLLICTASGYAQSGTEQQPMTVAEGLKKTDTSSKTYWVTGYVVGEIENYTNQNYYYEVAPPFNGSLAYLIADSKDEINLMNCMAIQFPGTNLIDEMGLDTNPEYWKKKITVCGLLRSYFGRPGIKSITTYHFEPFSKDDNEAIYWNFFENMDEKTYMPTSSSSVFAGGIYTGETGQWSLKGATWGDHSNDNKWGRASIRLRLTEGSRGEKGSLELISDKENGIGELRFWAGNYEEDASKMLAVSVYYSTDSGKSWTPIVIGQGIKRGKDITTNGMSEYSFKVNQPGTIRIKIEKADDTSGGINIDHIRISDYKTATGIASTRPTGSIGYGTTGGIRITAGNGQNIRIYSVSGQCVRTIRMNSEDCFIAMPKGVYLLQNDTRTIRVLVQ